MRCTCKKVDSIRVGEYVVANEEGQLYKGIIVFVTVFVTVRNCVRDDSGLNESFDNWIMGKQHIYCLWHCNRESFRKCQRI